MANEFSGFPPDTFKFLGDLAANNSKDWFDGQRGRYEELWKTPALDLTQALARPMAGLMPPLKAEARINGTLRRINRDVRFSQDKSPYSARIHLIFWAGNHPNRSPAFHLVLSADGIGYGAGVFGLENAAVQAYRNRILDRADRQVLMQAIQTAENIQCEFDVPELKKLPSGYQAQGDWEHLLRRKAFVMRTMANLPVPAWVHTGECSTEIMALTTGLMPLIQWLSV